MPTASPRPSPRPEPVRLQKFLAEGGFGSRRACERLIAEGRVAVGGAVVREQGVQVDPSSARVTVDGRPVGRQTLLYLLLHKPLGYVCTSSDPSGRPTFHELLPPLPARVYSAGRLDMDSEGLLLVTNDGPLVQRLTHPRHHAVKVYRVWADRDFGGEDLAALRRGVVADGERLACESVERRGRAGARWMYEVRLREGRNRQVRRMFGACGARVTRLVRIQFGPLRLDALPPGGWRRLTPGEIAALRDEAGLTAVNPPPAR